MNNPTTELKDLIHVERGIIPSYICNRVVKEIEKGEWSPHQWYNLHEDSRYSEETQELDVQSITDELQKLLNPAIFKALGRYSSLYKYKEALRTDVIYSTAAPVRFNRYSSGQIMRQHHDHIHSLFDGKSKGIPVLSIIINFNNDYEGADLFFWKDYVVKLGKGDIIMFPSLFLFPHGVTEATRGVRYSGAVWGW